MVLVATDTIPMGIPISAPPFFDNAAFGFTTIKPGEVLQGEIRLASGIPDLVEMLKKRDMLLFWAYQPSTVNQTRGKWVGGWLLLPETPLSKGGVPPSNPPSPQPSTDPPP